VVRLWRIVHCWRVGNNLGVESEEEVAAFVDLPVCAVV
jgi:hypothetical protein